MPERCALLLFLGLLLPGMAGAVSGAWVLEYGLGDASLSHMEDAGCDAPDSGPTRFLSCRTPGRFDSEAGSSWALGFDTPLTAADIVEPVWWAGFRIGRHAGMSVDGHLPAGEDGVSDPLSMRLFSDYALAQLRRDLPLGDGRLLPYLAAGAGVARNQVRDLVREREEASWQAPEGTDSGYLLRLELGLEWRLSPRLSLGMALRHDALDGFSTPRDTGRIQEADGEREQGFEAVRGRMGVRSVLFRLALPFGDSGAH